MANVNKKTVYITVPDKFYSVLYLMRFDNNNCLAIEISKGETGNKEYFDALRYDTGLEYCMVFPESNSPTKEWLSENNDLEAQKEKFYMAARKLIDFAQSFGTKEAKDALDYWDKMRSDKK